MSPTPPKPGHHSIRLPRPLWIGVATGVLVIVALSLRFGIPTYRQRAAIGEEFDSSRCCV
jgi:hypothetical protein